MPKHNTDFSDILTVEEACDVLCDVMQFIGDKEIRDIMQLIGDDLGIELRGISLNAVQEFVRVCMAKAAVGRERLFQMRGAPMPMEEWMVSSEADDVLTEAAYQAVIELFGTGRGTA